MMSANDSPSFPDGIWRDLGLTDAEYHRIVLGLGRSPSWAELGMFSAMWSEHCSYKNSKPVLRLFPTEGARVIQGPGENAGVVDIGDGQAIAFKIESHNHPSAIEPYQGAATGVGGIIRDVFTMGARPIALLDSLRFGHISQARVRRIFTGVVSGIAGYGNCVGIPTVGGETFFQESYNGNPLVNAMCVGILQQGDRIYKGIATGVGNPIFYVGARTGRDGINGATFASEELNDTAESKVPAVQAGDPFMEKLLLEACLEVMKTDAVVGIQDMGAAGLTSSSCEMASRGQSGIDIDVALVPQRETGMSPYEILLSESQERMLICVRRGYEETVCSIFSKWSLEAVAIGEVTTGNRVVIRDQGIIVADIPASLLTDDAPVYEREARRPSYLDEFCSSQASPDEPDNWNDALLSLLSSPNICSKKWITEQYDHMIGTSTVQKPGGDAAVMRIKGTSKGLALATDCNSRFVYLDPFLGGAHAVAEAARNIVCVGAKPLAMTNCLNFGNPEKPEVFYTFREAVKGMAEACEVLDTPVTGGNVSFYNESFGQAIFPTPTVGMVGLLEDIRCNTTMALPGFEAILLLLGSTDDELGGSEYLYHFRGEVSGKPPGIDLSKEKKLQNFVLEAIHQGLIESAHDCSEGGIAVSLAEMAIAGRSGLDVTLLDSLSAVSSCFSETASRIIVAVKEENLPDLLSLARRDEQEMTRLGFCRGSRFRLSHNQRQLIDLTVADLRESWEGALECYLR